LEEERILTIFVYLSINKSPERNAPGLLEET
jgi:hypothetical protein